MLTGIGPDPGLGSAYRGSMVRAQEGSRSRTLYADLDCHVHLFRPKNTRFRVMV